MFKYLLSIKNKKLFEYLNIKINLIFKDKSFSFERVKF